MTAPVMFNRRLSKNELDIWIDLLESKTDFGYTSRDLAFDFLSHKDTISFISSVESEVIGGTVIFRDRTRLGMVLTSVAVNDDFREKGAYNIIKSSLPFFKSVAIRDVDALIPDDSTIERAGFPSSLELDHWAMDVLERIGFENKGTLFAYVIENPSYKDTNKSELKWDSSIDFDNIKNFIWDLSKSTGLTNSFIWTALEFARVRGTLRTVTLEDSMKLAFNFNVVDTTAIIDVLVSDETFNEDASRFIVQTIKESAVDTVRFTLVGTGQSELVERIADLIGGSLKRRSMTLMRKPL